VPRLAALLAHQSLVGFTLGGRTRLCRLLNQLGAQTIHLFINRLLNLGQRRFRMRYSPLGDGGKGFLSLFFPVLLQVFWLHLGSLFWTLRTTPVLFASVPPVASTLPVSYSKQTAQKNETHPICGKNLYLSIISDILSVTALLKRQIGAIFTQRRE
jgi:hypothetical protein